MTLRLVPAPASEGEIATSSPIRVVLAEEHGLLRKSLRSLLDAEEGIEVIAEAEHLAAALQGVRRGKAHVLVLDVGMVQGSSREAIGELRARAPATQVVLLAMEESPVVAQHVLASGALGFVLKDRADGELAEAVRAAAQEEQYISPRVADRLNSALRRSQAER